MLVSLLALVSTSLTQSGVMAQRQLHKMIPADGADGEQFGFSVAIDGDRAIVGSDLDLDGGIPSGSAFVYDVHTGQQLYKLLPPDPQSWMMFGCSVALAGDQAVIGALGYSHLGALGGGAFLYDLTTGLPTHLLTTVAYEAGDALGVSVAISEEYIVVGAPGETTHGTWSGSIFVFDSVTGAELRRINPADGHANDNFGCSVAVSGDRIVAGAFYDDEMGWTSGSAYVFEASTGQQLFKLAASDGDDGDYFGWRVAIDGGRALVGAYQDDDFGSNSGSAYLFDITTGQQLHKLLPDHGAAWDLFGYDVSISDGLAVVGMPYDNTMSGNAGSAYTFDAYTGEEVGRIFADDAAPGDRIAKAVGVSGYVAVLGAQHMDNARGAAYLCETVRTGTGYCFGDPVGGTPCPCGNSNDGSVPGSGCANGAFASGAQLTGEGIPSVSDDNVILTTTGMDPGNSGLYFQANDQIGGGGGVFFGDGLRCAGGILIRLQVRASNGAGASSTTVTISDKGGAAAGDTKRYQCWYRDTSGLQPCGAGVYDFNLSNGFEITWRP